MDNQAREVDALKMLMKAVLLVYVKDAQHRSDGSINVPVAFDEMIESQDRFAAAGKGEKLHPGAGQRARSILKELFQELQ